ncbi:MAG: FKBP-type peptidyl-prolyl cis-trans isomerase [Actinobacteria bacterium]|nr:FKBP-type peptidyl-prolyl cis-trans isomerase [Actinomycetota bacterium]
MNRRLTPAALLVVLVAGITACGTNKGAEPEVAFTVPAKAAATAPSSSTTPQNCTPATVTPPPADQKPTVDQQPVPTQLVTNDVTVGDGAEAKAGDTVKMEYVGVLQKDGTEFDSSWSRNAEPFDFTLGQGMVIKGWDQGIAGMKVGGRRVLVIPADLAYGDKGSPPKIGANEPLVFVVDLLQVCSPAAPASTPAPNLSLPAAAPDLSTAPSTSAAPTTTVVPVTTPAPTTTAAP